MELQSIMTEKKPGFSMSQLLNRKFRNKFGEASFFDFKSCYSTIENHRKIICK